MSRAVGIATAVAWTVVLACAGFFFVLWLTSFGTGRLFLAAVAGWYLARPAVIVLRKLIADRG